MYNNVQLELTSHEFVHNRFQEFPVCTEGEDVSN